MISKQTFQRLALVTIVVLLATIASQQLMAVGQRVVFDRHDHHERVVDVRVIADRRVVQVERELAQVERELAREARVIAREARQMAREARRTAHQSSHLDGEVCDLSDELRELHDRIRVEVQ